MAFVEQQQNGEEVEREQAPLSPNSDTANKRKENASDRGLLWTPSQKILDTSHWTRFTKFVNEQHGLSLAKPDELWTWSVEHLEAFWDACWKYTGVISSAPYEKVIDDASKMPGAKFFPGAKLNFAENLLRFRDDHPAIIFKAETSNRETVISYKELYVRVAQLAARLAELGVVPGDRVVAYMPNIPETIIAMLAATTLGAIWSSCSPDFGSQGVLDRFAQIELIVSLSLSLSLASIDHAKGGVRDRRVLLQGQPRGHDAAAARDHKPAAVRGESGGISLHDPGDARPRPLQDLHERRVPGPVFARVQIVNQQQRDRLCAAAVRPPGLRHVQQRHDGAAKVPRAGTRRAAEPHEGAHDRTYNCLTSIDEDVCTWMMWNWLVSVLGAGATVVIFDGNPLYPSPSALWEYAQNVGVTVFGTSARYLAAVMDAGCKPGKEFNLSKLRLIASTGSPASTNIFKFVYGDIKSDVQFASISGGTDLNGCFALGCTNLPVYNGELQVRGLGLDVHIYNDDGKEVFQEQGELICGKPFPSMPLHFWNDSDGAKYFDAYFDTFPNIWRHGDFAEVTKNGGVVIYGRSDATLKPCGVRIGTADIYKIMEAMDEIADSIVIGQNYTLNDGTPDVRIVLFVVMTEGFECTPEFKKKVTKHIREQASPRHMPGLIAACPEIPYTVSGKKVELTVKKIIDGHAVTNKSALRNPESLPWFEAFAATLKNDN